MNRLETFLKKKVEDIKVAIRIKKVETALQAATANAEEQKINAELKLQSIMEDMAESSDLSNCIQKISAVFDEVEEAEATLKRVEKIKAYLNEDVK